MTNLRHRVYILPGSHSAKAACRQVCSGGGAAEYSLEMVRDFVRIERSGNGVP